MYNKFIEKDNCVYYCNECDKIYNYCYELQNIIICSVCWSEDVKIIKESDIQPFIRSKRLKKLNQISKKL